MGRSKDLSEPCGGEMDDEEVAASGKKVLLACRPGGVASWVGPWPDQ